MSLLSSLIIHFSKKERPQHSVFKISGTNKIYRKRMWQYHAFLRLGSQAMHCHSFAEEKKALR